MKIILGSANLEKKYGILNKKLKNTDFNLALNFLLKNSNNYIETSLEYNSIEILNKIKNLNKYKITLKINLKDKNNLKKVYNFIKYHKIKKIYCIMLHNPDELIKKNQDVYKKLIELKNNKICKYIGISLYNFNIFETIIKKYNFDVVQAPLNIFDQTILNKNKIKQLKKKKIIFQARSIFLQGTLLNKNKFSYTKYFKKFDRFVINSNFSRLFHCINFIKQFSFIKFVVIGISSYKDIREIFENFKMKKKKLITQF